MTSQHWPSALEPMPDGTAYADLLPAARFGAAPISTGVTLVPPGVRSWSHAHTDTEVFAFVAGEGVMEIAGERRTVRRGDVVLIPPLSAHSVQNTGGEGLELMALWWCDRAAELEALRGRAGGVIDAVPGGGYVVMPAFPTPNGELHLGHLAGPYLAADVLARCLRQQGEACATYCGADQLQTYVELCFSDPGREAEAMASRIEASLAAAGIRHGVFLRPLHDAELHAAARDAYERLLAAGVYELRRTRMPFDPETGEPLVEARVQGHCPHCRSAMSGLACEACGALVSEDRLLEPASAATGRPAELREVERIVMQLEPFRATVVDFADRCALSANLKAFLARTLAAPLPEVPVTHPGSWGLDVGVAGRLYTHGDEPAFWAVARRRLGLEDERRAVWLFGMDNAFLYAVITPVLFRALGLPWPQACHANHFYRLAGEKFSTSRKHLVTVVDGVERVGRDWLRLHLAVTRPELAETDFTLESAIAARDDLRARWLGFVRDAVQRSGALGEGRTVESGVWNAGHVAAFNALDDARRAAGRAADPAALSLPALVAALEATVAAALALRARQPAVAGTETFEAEERTTVALELAAVRQLAVLLAPLAPGIATAIGTAIGLDDDPAAIPWARALELQAGGLKLLPQALEELLGGPCQG